MGTGSSFAPGLSDPDLIGRLCLDAGLPINIMRLPGMVSNAGLGTLGFARISYGPAPWREAMARVEDAARAAFTTD
ncbi:MAG: isocitrate lyase/phosphoenolpyruvate mutase family protein [Pseudomonadota bacterium]